MKHLLRFIMILSLGLVILYAVIGKEALFPTSEKKPEGQSSPKKNATPLANTPLGKKKVQVANEDVDIKSFGWVPGPDGRQVQKLRFRLRAKSSKPNPNGTYTLTKSTITFYNDLSRPMIILGADKMVLEAESGSIGFNPKEKQKMVLTGVKISSASGFNIGDLELVTEKLILNTTGEVVSFTTAEETMPYEMTGILADGQLRITGEGMQGELPPLPRQGKEKQKPKATTAEEPALAKSFYFRGRGNNQGFWHRPKDSAKVHFSCSGPLQMNWSGTKKPPRLTLHEKVRANWQGNQDGTMRGDEVTMEFSPRSADTDRGERAPKNNRQKKTQPGLIRMAVIKGSPAEMGSPLGKISAQQFRMDFNMRGGLSSLRAEKVQALRGKLQDDGEFKALRCGGNLRVIGLQDWNPPGSPISPLRTNPLICSLPGYLLDFGGPWTMEFPETGGATTLAANEGIQILLGRKWGGTGKQEKKKTTEPTIGSSQNQILMLAGFGQCKINNPEFILTSDNGFHRTFSPLFPGSGTTRLGPPGLRIPVAFQVTNKAVPGKNQSFSLTGSGFLSQTTNARGSNVITASAYGPKATLQIAGKTAAEDFQLHHIQHTTLTQATNEDVHLRATPFWHTPLRMDLEKRQMTAWGYSLDVTIRNQGGNTAFLGNLTGNKTQDALLLTKLTKPGEPTTDASPVIQLLSPKLVFSDRETVLRATTGFRMRVIGSSLLPKREDLARKKEDRPTKKTKTTKDSLQLLGERQTMYAQGRELGLEKAGGEKPEIFRMFDNLVIRAKYQDQEVVGRGSTLYAQLGNNWAKLDGSPATVELVNTGGNGRNVKLSSAIMHFSPDKLIAGDLASGIGGEIHIYSNKNLLGQALTTGSHLRAVCGMPIHVTQENLNFTGVTSLSQTNNDPKHPLLVCGQLLCLWDPEGKEIFSSLLAEKGVKLKVRSDERDLLLGKGEWLSYDMKQGKLFLDGDGKPCEMQLAEQTLTGTEIEFNVNDFTWKVRDFLSKTNPRPATVRKGEVKTK